MNKDDFDLLFKKLKMIIRSGYIDEYCKYNPIELYSFTDIQSIQILKCINAERFVRACKFGLDIPMNYSNESIITLDLIVSQLCALDTSYTKIEKKLIDDISDKPDIIRYIGDQKFYNFFCCLFDKFSDLILKAKNNTVYYSEIGSLIDDEIIIGTIMAISDYLGEACIENFGGHWDIISTFEGDIFGVVMSNGNKVSFYQTVYNRFYKSNLPIGFIYAQKTGFNYSHAMNNFLERLKNINK